METNSYSRKDSGFALLMALLVVGVLITIGLSVLELTIKQVQLATTARDSEIAFHAANAGMECSRYWRRERAVEMETGASINPVCFGISLLSPISPTSLSGDISAGTGEAYLYNYSFTWGTDLDRCTEVTTMVASSSISGATDLVVGNMTTYFPGYTDGTTKECEPGARCTVMSVKGYNKPCSSITNYGTVEREVLLQF
jgi:Tfp pilus assembly protein PilX